MTPRVRDYIERYPKYLLEKLLRIAEVKENGCIEWTRVVNQDGYGRVRILDSLESVHRIVLFCTLQIQGIEWRQYAEVMHSCRNPPCINPEHLSQGTHLINMQDMIFPSRQGSLNVKAKLTEEDVLSIRERSKQVSRVRLAREYRVHVSTIRRVINESTWGHVE